MEKRDQQKVRTREKERESRESSFFSFTRKARFVSCEVFRDLWEREDRETKSRYLYASRAFGVIIVQNIIIYIYISSFTSECMNSPDR